jgi:lipoprotein-anchoring transpeptidase ErfK/SrfK
MKLLVGASATCLLAAVMATPAAAQYQRYGAPPSYQVSPLPSVDDDEADISYARPRAEVPSGPYGAPQSGPYAAQPQQPYLGRGVESHPLPPMSSPPPYPTTAERRPYGESPYTGSVQQPQEQYARPPANVQPGGSTVAGLPPEDQPEQGPAKELPERFKRQMVDYPTKEPAGTLIVDTPNTYLYLVLGNGKAMRYGIGVGREGFTWSGTERITRMAEWPDWHPPAEMIERQPYLPRFMAGGESNPLGARALYLGKTVYRIHGTNQPSTIGQTVSSGCIRLVNSDIEDLYQRVQVGTKVVVLPGKPAGSSHVASQAPAPAGSQPAPQSISPQPLLPPEGVPQQAQAGYPRRY